MSEMKDFVIEDGVLIEYKGQDDNIIIPDGVTVIGSGAFKNRAIKGITIPESVITIEDIAFIGCWFDKKIKIPHSVTSIGCRNFNDYDLAAPPANAIVCNVDNHVLECCRGGGKELIVSADVEAIDLYDCYCKNVEKIIIGNNVQDIAAGTLSKFNNLREIIVKELSAPVLEQNRNLSPFDRIGMGHVAHYSSPYATIDGVLYNSSMTKLICVPPKYPNEYTIPQNVTSISKYAFCGCEQLSKIIIPDDVAYLGDNAFEGCTALASVSLPISLRRIGKNVFHNCSSLNPIIIRDANYLTNKLPSDLAHYPLALNDEEIAAVRVKMEGIGSPSKIRGRNRTGMHSRDA